MQIYATAPDSFPFFFELGGLRLPAHFVFEALAYAVGFRLYLWQRARSGDFLTTSTRWTVVAAGIVGAALGSKGLYLLGDPATTAQHLSDPFYLMGGKTIVGGLLGGWVAVELVKRRIGVRRATGDLFVIPTAIGIAIGRIGCFLSGLPDNTYGIETALPFGVDFGDGVGRHPTQLYELAFLLALAGSLSGSWTSRLREGDLFKLFMASYLTFRLVIEIIKPRPTLAGLSAIQWACVLGLAYLTLCFLRRRQEEIVST